MQSHIYCEDFLGGVWEGCLPAGCYEIGIPIMPEHNMIQYDILCYVIFDLSCDVFPGKGKGTYPCGMPLHFPDKGQAAVVPSPIIDSFPSNIYRLSDRTSFSSILELTNPMTDITYSSGIMNAGVMRSSFTELGII